MSRRPWWNLEPCGTPAAYRRHRRKGEQACRRCRRAWADAALARSRARAEAHWREVDEADWAAYEASVEAWRAEHEASVARQQERAVRTLVALLAEACDAA